VNIGHQSKETQKKSFGLSREGLNVKRQVVSEAFTLLSACFLCAHCAHTYKPTFNDKHVSYKLMIFERKK